MNFRRPLFVLVALLHAAPGWGILATPATSGDPEWAVSMKFNSQPCTLSSASNAFVRNPMGCNPTPSGVAAQEGSSWTVECASNGWSIVRYLDPMLKSSGTYDRTFNADVLQSCLDRNMTDAMNDTLPLGSTCQANAKGQFEQNYCYQSLGASMDPWGAGRAHWSIGLALYNAAGCNDDDMFMYEFRSNGVCIDEGDHSQRWSTDGGKTIIKKFTSRDCSGTAVTGAGAHPYDNKAPAEVPACITPYANGLWMKIIRWDGLMTTAPTAMPATTSGAWQWQSHLGAPIVLIGIVVAATHASVRAF